MEIRPGELKQVVVKCWDAHGNLTKKTYTLKGSESLLSDNKSNEISSVSVPATYSAAVVLKDGGVSVVWPKHSFYSRETASLRVVDDLTFEIGPIDAPLAKPFTLSLICAGISPSNVCEKWVVERLSNSGSRLGVEICKSSSNSLKFSSRKMGRYHLLQDTIPPRLLPKFSSSPLIKNGNLVFHIEDELSGVSKIEGFIDDKWVLFHWDPKSKTATYRASDLQHIPGDTQTVRFISQDGVGLISEWSGKVTFP